MSLKGSCLCGAVNYTADTEPTFCGHCHCLDCQKESGCGHVTVVGVPDAMLTLSGPTAAFGKAGASGQLIERTFCTTCGTTLFSRAHAMAGVTMLRAGTLDEPSKVTPGMSIYASRAASWDAPSTAIPAFPEMPPPRPH